MSNLANNRADLFTKSGLYLGLSASLAANVASARFSGSVGDSALSIGVSAIPVLLLFVAIEMVATAWRTRRHISIKTAVTVCCVPIAGLAAWASFHHILHVVISAGQPKAYAWGYPIAIDAMMAISTILMAFTAKVTAPRANRTQPTQPSQPVKKAITPRKRATPAKRATAAVQAEAIIKEVENALA